MKTIHNITSVLVAAGTAGVALLTFSGSLSANLGFALLGAFGVAGIALFDYARPVKSLRPLAPVLRPALPAAAPATRRLSAIVEKAA
jgi:hypothetical protein